MPYITSRSIKKDQACAMHYKMYLWRKIYIPALG